MGKVNLAWRKACAVRGIGFTPDQQAAGWPEGIDIGRIARLQSLDDRGNERIIYAGLLADCKSGDLIHTAATVTVAPKPPPVQRRNEFASSEWLGEFGRFGLTGVRNGRITAQPPPQPRDVTTYTVTAPAYAAWLTAQSEAPSPHIQAWFDAVGVAADIERHTNEADSVRWTDERKTEARAMIDRLRGAGTRAYMAETAKHYGVSATRLREVLKDGNFKPTKSKPVVNSVFALAGKRHRLQ